MSDDTKAARRRFARVYYDDLERDYPGLFYDPTALATWLRLLILSEKAWPALPELPKAVRRSDLDKLVSLGIFEHQPHSRFVLRGWVKDRTERAVHGQKAVSSRKDRPTPVLTRVPTPVPSRVVPAHAGASFSTSISTSQTEGVQGEPDAIDAFQARTGEIPGPKMLRWLNDIAKSHGEPRLIAALTGTPMGELNVSDYIRSLQDRLRLEDARAEKAEKRDEEHRNAAKREPIRLVAAQDVSEDEAKRLAAEYHAASRRPA